MQAPCFTNNFMNSPDTGGDGQITIIWHTLTDLYFWRDWVYQLNFLNSAIFIRIYEYVGTLVTTISSKTLKLLMPYLQVCESKVVLHIDVHLHRVVSINWRLHRSWGENVTHMFVALYSTEAFLLTIQCHGQHACFFLETYDTSVWSPLWFAASKFLQKYVVAMDTKYYQCHKIAPDESQQKNDHHKYN